MVNFELGSVFTVYLLLINVVALCVYGIDKWLALRHRWRVKEATLLTLALIGGSVGALAAMYIFRHKTRKPMFKYGVPAMFVLHLLIATGLYLFS